MWNIGNVKIANKIVLAPMAGIVILLLEEFVKTWDVD